MNPNELKVGSQRQPFLPLFIETVFIKAELEENQVSTDRWMDEQNIVDPYDGLCLKKAIL